MSKMSKLGHVLYLTLSTHLTVAEPALDFNHGDDCKTPKVNLQEFVCVSCDDTLRTPSTAICLCSNPASINKSSF